MKRWERPIHQFKILVINPGSTSTKVALFQGSDPVISRAIPHPDHELSQSNKIIDQLCMREKAVRDFIDENRITEIDAVAGRGGLLKPLQGGAYRVNLSMLDDLQEGRYGEHASNLGPMLAYRFGEAFGSPAYIVDPVTVDEHEPASKISGVPGIERKSRTHALNIKSVSRRCAKEIGKNIKDTSFVAVHLGGGISVCALSAGKIIDSTDALLGEGPFSMERSGTLPLTCLVDLCFDKGLSKKAILTLLSRQSGFKGYIGTDRLPEVLERIDAGDAQTILIFEAMVRQIVKWVGAMIAVVKGKPDAVILTGGMVNSKYLVDAVCSHIKPMAEVRIYPGEFEMEALAESVLRVLHNIESALAY